MECCLVAAGRCASHTLADRRSGYERRTGYPGHGATGREALCSRGKLAVYMSPTYKYLGRYVCPAVEAVWQYCVHAKALLALWARHMYIYFAMRI